MVKTGYAQYVHTLILIMRLLERLYGIIPRYKRRCDFFVFAVERICQDASNKSDYPKDEKIK